MGTLTYAATQQDSSLLLGIAAIITAVGAIIVGTIRYWRAPAGGEDDELSAAIVKERKILRDTIKDLENSLTACRAERRVLEAESKVKDMEIGNLQGRLAEAKRRERELNDGR